jgi:hypothetical protein
VAEEEDATTEEEEEDSTVEDVAEEDAAAGEACLEAGAASSLRGNVSEVRKWECNGRSDFTEVGVSPERTQPVMSVRALGQVTFSQSTSGLWMSWSVTRISGWLETSDSRLSEKICSRQKYGEENILREMLAWFVLPTVSPS